MGTDKAEVRSLKRSLRDLANTTEQFLDQLDVLMRQPSTVERGRHVAKLCNVLEMEKDKAKHFGLGLPLKKGVESRAEARRA